jgi:hypothetical protein
MQPSRVAAWIFVAVVAAAWLASAAGVSRNVRQPPRPPVDSPAVVAIDGLAAEVQTQAARLRQRLEGAPSPTPPFRNPFAFAERAPAPARVAPAPKSPPPSDFVPPPTIPAEPPLQLIGIAEKKIGDTVVRTAMLSPGDADALIMAKAGETILGAYEVVAVGVDAVELKDLVTGASRTLVLK